MLDAFFQMGPIPSSELKGHYSPSLVILSYIIAAFASYVALDLAGRLRAETQQKNIVYWLLGGAFAMGTGIWSMHFIGMLAFTLPLPMYYGLVLTGLSLVIAILASAFALFLFKAKQSNFYIILGGIFLGFGIAAMHYTGMAAMTVHVTIHYELSIFLLSILIAIVASEAALWLVVQSNQGSFKRQIRLKFASALVMGAAICGMHYTGMAAAVFTPGTCLTTPQGVIQPEGLAYYIAAATVLIMGLALFVSTYKQLMSSALEKEKEFLKALLHNLADGILACDMKGNLTLMNPAARHFHGIPDDDEIVTNWQKYFTYYYPDGKTPLPPEEMPLARVFKDQVIKNFEVIIVPTHGKRRNLLIDGRTIMVDEKRLGAIIAFHDITERKQMETQLMEQATRDPLTQVSNRTMLYDRITQAIIYAKRVQQVVNVLFIDLDRFKIINDSLGHDTGDELLKMAASRLRQCVRESDTVARIGGDEFVIVLTLQTEAASAISSAQQILKKMLEPFWIKDNELVVTCSIGISSYPKDGSDPETLIKKADTAMYRVKRDKHNGFQFYTEEINVSALEKLVLENQLRHAVERKEFALYYQPSIDLESGKIVGVEALIRWKHPQLGLVLPAGFISLAEETGLIVPIGEWVLRTACAQCKAWHEMGLPLVKMAVNLSPVQFKSTQVEGLVKRVLAETHLEGNYLELELTESTIVENAAAILKTLSNLKAIGVRIVIDDFGTGYSNLGYLKRLPIDKLKIDRSFIKDVDSNKEDAAIVLAVIAMANSMKLSVVAEGMETKSQLGFLRFHRCDEIQGYYFSKPITAEECTELLKKNINFLPKDPKDKEE
jgi:diguanylate cyclase (GGDEF)-like protein/PAS domain S-box-containing protein